MIDVTYGNISEDEAEKMRIAVFPRGDEDYPAGATEPWIGNLVHALLCASGAVTVLETGCFMGHTSRLLHEALYDRGDCDLILCEIDPARAAHLAAQFAFDSRVRVSIRQQDALSVIRSLPDQWLGFAWVDDDHSKSHVAEEIEALLPKMQPGGIICFHDTFGVCDLQEVVAAYGGYSLDLPRAGPAGGLGILQIR